MTVISRVITTRAKTPRWPISNCVNVPLKQNHRTLVSLMTS